MQVSLDEIKAAPVAVTADFQDAGLLVQRNGLQKAAQAQSDQGQEPVRFTGGLGISGFRNGVRLVVNYECEIFHRNAYLQPPFVFASFL
jgi:hypothetical protein